MKTFIMVFSQRSPQEQEKFDLLLGASIFYDKLITIFIDDGVWLLLNEQCCTKLQQKNLNVQLQALPIYEIPIYASIESLQQRNIISENLITDVQCIPDHEIKKFLKKDTFIWN